MWNDHEENALDSRRLIVTLLVLALGFGLLTWHVMGQRDGQAGVALAQDAAPSAPQTAPADEAPPADAAPADDAAPPAPPAPAAGEAPLPAEAPRTAAPARPAPSATAPAAPAPRRTWRWLSAPPRQLRLGSLRPTDPYAFEVELVNEGAAVTAVRLRGYYETVKDKMLADEDWDLYRQALREQPDEYRGNYNIMQPFAFRGSGHRPLETRSVTFTPPGQDRRWTFSLSDASWRVVEGPTTGEGGAQSVRFAWTIEWDFSQGQGESDWRDLMTVYKTYTIRPASYSIEVDLAVENHTADPLAVSLDQKGPTGIRREEVRGDQRRVAYGVLKGEEVEVSATLDHAGRLYKLPVGRHPEDVVGGSAAESPVLWIGYTNKFFGSMLYLAPREEGQLAAPSYSARFYAYPGQATASERMFVTGVELGGERPLVVAPGQVVTAKLDVFAGPKDRDVFLDQNNPFYRPLYQRLGYSNTIVLGSCTWDWLTLGMMWLLEKFAAIAFGNYGVAIIVLVVLVRLALHPLTKRSQVAMSRMQKLGPKMKEIQEKYAHDKQAQQRETMKFYREHGGGMLGCLPMLLQMPIWIALYSGLNALIELRHAAFLPFWLTDLSAPDTVISWAPYELPLIGTGLHLLPILLAFAFVLQMKINPQMAGGQPGAMTEQQQAQQKMMKWMMPAMMLFVLYTAPSGLNLYIMTSTFAGVAEQYVIRKHIREREEAQAMKETTIEVPGKALRGSRPKKPKGPGFMKHG